MIKRRKPVRDDITHRKTITGRVVSGSNTSRLWNVSVGGTGYFKSVPSIWDRDQYFVNTEVVLALPNPDQPVIISRGFFHRGGKIAKITSYPDLTQDYYLGNWGGTYWRDLTVDDVPTGTGEIAYSFDSGVRAGLSTGEYMLCSNQVFSCNRLKKESDITMTDRSGKICINGMIEYCKDSSNNGYVRDYSSDSEEIVSAASDDHSTKQIKEFYGTGMVGSYATMQAWDWGGNLIAESSLKHRSDPWVLIQNAVWLTGEDEITGYIRYRNRLTDENLYYTAINSSGYSESAGPGLDWSVFNSSISGTGFFGNRPRWLARRSDTGAYYISVDNITGWQLRGSYTPVISNGTYGYSWTLVSGILTLNQIDENNDLVKSFALDIGISGSIPYKAVTTDNLLFLLIVNTEADKIWGKGIDCTNEEVIYTYDTDYTGTTSALDSWLYLYGNKRIGIGIGTTTSPQWVILK